MKGNTLLKFGIVLTMLLSMNVTYAKKKAKIICIDAGHQTHANYGLEPIGPGSSTKKMKVSAGTQGRYTKKAESLVNLQVARKLQKILIKRGYKVVMVRTSQNVNISNRKRAMIANKAHADIMIRLHCNGSADQNIHGYFILTSSLKNRYISASVVNKSLKLTKCLLPTIHQVTGAADRGIFYRDDLTGTNWCKVPTALIEMGEMKNKQEDINLSKKSYQKKMAKGIADGIDHYFKK